jgi:hypothetical protein
MNFKSRDANKKPATDITKVNPDHIDWFNKEKDKQVLRDHLYA